LQGPQPPRTPRRTPKTHLHQACNEPLYAHSMARARASDSPARDWPPVSYWLKVAVGVIVLIALAKAIVILRQILILMGVSMILAIGFQPTIAWFERKGVKRGLAVTIMTLAAILVIGGFIALVVPTIITEVRQLIDKAPDYIRRAQHDNSFFASLNKRFDLTTKLQDLAGKAP